MLLQLTTAGKALLDAEPVGVPITRVDFGDGFNYSLPLDPTGLDGSLVYQSNTAFDPEIIDANTVRYTVYLPMSVATFTFGEVALYSDATLIGVGVSPAQITKQGPAEGFDGSEFRIDFFIDLTPGQRYAVAEVVSSEQVNSFPRVPIPDLLVPPAKNRNNAYVIYGLLPTDVPYFAFADPTGKWAFSSKTTQYYNGTVSDVNSLGLESLDLNGSYPGSDRDLVLQWTSGRLRGYCRQLINLTEDGGIQWNTPLAELPDVGDSFIIVGPQGLVAGPGGEATARLAFRASLSSSGGFADWDNFYYFAGTGEISFNESTLEIEFAENGAYRIIVVATVAPTSESWSEATELRIENLSEGQASHIPSDGFLLSREISKTAVFYVQKIAEGTERLSVRINQFGAVNPYAGTVTVEVTRIGEYTPS